VAGGLMSYGADLADSFRRSVQFATLTAANKIPATYYRMMRREFITFLVPTVAHNSAY
jgi:hypothetical protein